MNQDQKSCNEGTEKKQKRRSGLTAFGQKIKKNNNSKNIGNNLSNAQNISDITNHTSISNRNTEYLLSPVKNKPLNEESKIDNPRAVTQDADCINNTENGAKISVIHSLPVCGADPGKAGCPEQLVDSHNSTHESPPKIIIDKLITERENLKIRAIEPDERLFYKSAKLDFPAYL